MKQNAPKIKNSCVKLQIVKSRLALAKLYLHAVSRKNSCAHYTKVKTLRPVSASSCSNATMRTSYATWMNLTSKDANVWKKRPMI